ncbi:MAG: site-specific integrase, partial [Acidobacteria bacterium]|nr:site-specific integrase [Acidobacteriota bacterium]
FTFNGQPMKRLTTAFDRARRRAGLGEDVTFHTLRHTFASWFMMNGGDLYRLQRYMGHSTITLTQRYAHLSPDYMREGVEHFGPPKTDRESTGLKSAQNEDGPPSGDSVSR